MSGALPSLHQYAFMAWCLVKAQGQLYLYQYQASIESRQINSQVKYMDGQMSTSGLFIMRSFVHFAQGTHTNS